MAEISPNEIQALQDTIKALQLENKKLTRELKNERSMHERNRIHAQAKANLSKVILAERSRFEQYMNLMLNNTPDIIFIFDKAGEIVYTSEAFLNKTKTPSLSLVRGQTFQSLFSYFVSQEEADYLQIMLMQTLREKKRIETELDIDFSNSGNMRHYYLQTTPMVENNGEAEGAIAMLYDSTDITNARIEAERARELAEQSTRAKSDFLSRMSHEIRTPLNAIIGMTNIAKASGDITRIEYCLDKINEASQHLLGVINDILDISKIEADKFELSSGPFRFEKMLQRVTNVVNFRVDEKHQSFIVHLDEHIPVMLTGDEQRLAQVITNLLSNAVKFTPEGGSIRLEARLLACEDDICTLQIDVSDTGIGVAESQQSHLFTSFEQADGSISRKYGGTGLGLAISKRIVEMMGGEIWVKSTLGEGSTFSFTLRIQRSEEDARHSDMLRPDARLDNLRILAVDDAPEIRLYFQDIMRHFGLHCDVAASGEEALDMIENQLQPYDICFVDWQMPGMNGIALSRSIKERSGGKSIVIMISATEWTVIADEAKKAGVDNFLPKPLFPSTILDCINHYLGTEHQNTDTVAKNGIPEYFRKRHILLAEDVEINREIVSAMLEPTGLSIDYAENGAEALACFVSTPDKYDLIFMDVQMPEMDGYEATRRIRALDIPQAKSIPIVAMTANVFREDIEKCLAAGMNGHVGKPMVLDEVLDELRKYLLPTKAKPPKN